MDFTGRPMRGFVFVNPAGLATDGELTGWLKLALEFNPKAKSSKKKAAAPQTAQKLSARPKTRKDQSQRGRRHEHRRSIS